jgi:hypothetical protein
VLALLKNNELAYCIVLETKKKLRDVCRDMDNLHWKLSKKMKKKKEREGEKRERNSSRFP